MQCGLAGAQGKDGSDWLMGDTVVRFVASGTAYQDVSNAEAFQK